MNPKRPLGLSTAATTSQRFRTLALAAAVAVGGISAIGAAQPKPADDKAAALLATARSAANEKNLPAAIERYRQFLRENPEHKDVNAARFGLGVALVEAPQRDAIGAIAALQPPASDEKCADRPRALYYLGFAMRAVAVGHLEQAAATADAAQQQKLTVDGTTYLEAATQNFAAAARLFDERGKGTSNSPSAPPPPDAESAFGARCELAGTLLLLKKPKDALSAIEPALKSPALEASRHRNDVYFVAGLARFQSDDHFGAGRVLSNLAPFKDPVIGAHARFLLARTHQLAGERPEAAMHYESVLASVEPDRKAAAAALQNPLAFLGRPDDRLRLESFVKAVPPHVAETPYYYGQVLLDQGRSADAAQRFTQFVKQLPRHPLAQDATLRLGIAYAQNKQTQETITTLSPLADHPTLGAEALLWMGRAAVAGANPADANATKNAYNAAIAHFARAAAKAAALTDPTAPTRRAEILLEQADVNQLAKQYKPAAEIYGKVAAEKLPGLSEAALQRQAVALQLDGQYKPSEQVCQQFLQAYPKSPLVSDVLFRFAENAYLAAVTAPAADANKQPLYGEAIKRYEEVIAKYPEFPQVHNARLGLATSHYHLGNYAATARVLGAIPDSERAGELAAAGYLLADCLLRTLPDAGADALATAKVIDRLDQSRKLLGNFVSSSETSPHAPDALLKLGVANQKLAALIADATEKKTAYQNARAAYDRVMQKFPQSPAFPVAVFENGRLLATLGDPGNAMTQLSRFQHAPLRQSPAAPAALIQLGDLQRRHGQAPQAVQLLQQLRNEETALAKDPARADLVPQLRLTLGLALKDAGKMPEALAVFESVAKEYANKPQGFEALWRTSQAKRDEASARFDAARKALALATGKPPEVEKARAAVDESAAALRQIAQSFVAQSGQADISDELKLKMLYEAAVTNRKLADAEIAAAREKLGQDAQKALRARVAPEQPAAKPTPLPEPKLAAVPLQPAEKAARTHYAAVVESGSDADVVKEARVELADVLVARGEHDKALPLLSDALESGPPPVLADQVRLRIADCLIAKKDAAGALKLLDPIIADGQNPARRFAIGLAGECYALQNDWNRVVERLARYRDRPEYNNLPGASDRAMLRLAEGLAKTNQWDPARQTLEALVQRFPDSKFADEARFGIGFALQQAKQFDPAIKAYNELASRSGSQWGAKAQLQAGLCQLEQKKFNDAVAALMNVPHHYDFPDLAAHARYEAAKAHLELKQPDKARTQLQFAAKDPAWAERANKKLAEIK